MTLLLVLSALLSALTGSTNNVVRMVAPQTVTRDMASARAVLPARRVVETRPSFNQPTPITSAAAPLTVAHALTPITPIFAGRRRE